MVCCYADAQRHGVRHVFVVPRHGVLCYAVPVHGLCHPVLRDGGCFLMVYGLVVVCYITLHRGVVCVVLSCTKLWCILCNAVPRYVRVLSYAVPHRAVCVPVCCTYRVLVYAVLCCLAPWCVYVLLCRVMMGAILRCTVVWCVMLCCTGP